MATKLSKKITEIINNATPKQKAIIVVMDYIDQTTRRNTPLLTDEEVRAIADSLSTTEAKEYNKWIRCYNVYADLAPIIGLAISQYREKAEAIVGNIKVLESYTQEENHLNAVYEGLKEIKSEKALMAFWEAIENMTLTKGAELKRDEEGYIEIDTNSLFELIKEQVRNMEFDYMCLKAFIVALDEWTDKKKSKKLMPPILLKSVEAIKNETAIRIAPSYSRKFLKERIAKGVKITAAEEKRAIFPCYEDIPVDEEYVELWRKKIADTEKIYIRNGK